jgi:hypothetical protein
MPAIVNVPDFIKIGIMAFVAVWGINKALDAFGLSSLKA